MKPDCCICGHPRDDHGPEREMILYALGTTRREVCLMCPGFEEPGYPNGKAWHRYKEAKHE